MRDELGLISPRVYRKKNRTPSAVPQQLTLSESTEQNPNQENEGEQEEEIPVEDESEQEQEPERDPFAHLSIKQQDYSSEDPGYLVCFADTNEVSHLVESKEAQVVLYRVAKEKPIAKACEITLPYLIGSQTLLHPH